MIELTQEHNKTYTTANQLQNWSKNPRDLNDKGFQRLKDQITLLGQYAPLLVMPDGTVLSGNMRFKAIRELGIEKIWVEIIDFVEDNGLFYAILNGERQKKPFTSQLQGMTEYALSANDRAGQYNEDDLGNLLDGLEIDLEAYSVDTFPPITIQELIDNGGNDKKESYFVKIEAQNEVEKDEISSKLRELGYKVK